MEDGGSRIATEKAALRGSMLETLSGIRDEDAPRASDQASAVIADLLDELPSVAGRPVMSFATIRADGRGREIDLGLLHDRLMRDGRLALPRMDWENRTMRAMLLAPADALAESHLEVRRHGVPEPIGGAAVALDALGAVVVPGLAFDRAGHRLGRGAGFYDRFLSTGHAAGGPVLIGVGFGVQIVDSVPIEAHDRPVDWLVTEADRVRCGR